MEEKNLRFDKIVTKLLSIVGVSFVLGLIFDYFFYKSLLGISVLLYSCFILIGLLILSLIYKKKLNKSIIFITVPLLFFSTMVFVRSSTMLTFLNIIMSLYLLLMIANLDTGQKIQNYLLIDYFKIFLLPFRFVENLIKFTSGINELWGKTKKQKFFHSIIRGILISIPILIIFLILFSSADLVFRKYLLNLININTETIYRSIIVVIITLVFIGAYYYIFKRSNSIFKIKKIIKKTFSFGIIEVSVVLGLINLLFLIFILVQMTYLFGGEKNIIVHGFTYAQYARRGFFELITVAVISFLIIFIMEKYVFRKDENHTLQFKTLSGLLVILVILIMVSAFKRLLLYENAYGFTVLRLYSHIFIIWLAAVFILLLYKIFINRRENIFIIYFLTSVILFLMFVNLLNPDAFIAKQNIQRYYNTGKLDVFYLTQLSDDAIPETIKVLDIQDEDLRRPFANSMYRKWLYILGNKDYYEKCQSFNISRSRAIRILESNAKALKE
jgi:hypothetical protein